ncbi:pilus assembly protein PilP [Neisseria chenwenguii]|uniref:Pilin assembly protein n=1 Tax=Neisseria chenwenguii TaxID=1853278 RepID=A0A220S0C6_9NEIS|nr:pilus assembly protein PilP [Neisseria chenwenguii]ASK26838.1 pilin assembly protein [Neisseria chenwenguii]ROV56816.1 pilin assembly protein [Neisseria chenwenguii]
MKHTILLLGILSVTACTPTYDDLSKWTADTREKAKTNIIPFEAPTITPPKAYIPPAFSGLNSFDSRRLETAPKGGNAPNPNRRKEALEAFSLENLTYVGTLRSGGKISGYVKAGDHVYTVKPGNYLGQNHGRIQSITDDKIILTELIEDSYGNWVYRKAELPLNKKADDSNTQNATSAASASESAKPN